MNGSERLSEKSVLGTWKLVAYRFDYDDGTHEEPYGPDPIGMLHYSEDRHVFVHMMAAGRQPLGSDSSTATSEAAQAALGSHISYCGTFQVFDQTVNHEVLVSVLQDFVGLTLQREIEVAKDRLTLRGKNATFGGKRGTAVLEWARAD